MASTTGTVVRRYYEIVADLKSTERDLESLLHPDATLLEHPNPVVPQGAHRGVAETLAGFRAGRGLLSEQAFEIFELLTQGERAAVRARWQGVVGRNAGPFKQGDKLTAHVASFLTVREGLVLDHETFDCYEPFPSA